MPTATQETRLWKIQTYYGLFRPATTYFFRAVSKHEAECLATATLATDEWFPTFSATAMTGSNSPEHHRPKLPIH